MRQDVVSVRVAEGGKTKGLFIEYGLWRRGEEAGHHLHELHVDEPRPCPQCQGVPRPCDIGGREAVLKQPAVAARGEDDRLTANGEEAVLRREHCAAHASAALNEFQCLMMGAAPHPVFRQLLLEDGTHTGGFQTIPISPLVVKTGDKLFFIGFFCGP